MRLFRDNLSQELFETWFKPIAMVSYTDNVVHLAVPSPFYKEHIESNFLDLMRKVLRHVYGIGVDIKYHYQIVKGQQDTDVAVAGSSTSTAVGNRNNAANPFVAKGDDEID